MSFHPHPLIFVLLGMILGSIVPEGGTAPALAGALALAALISTIAMARPCRVGAGALLWAATAAGASLATTARIDYRTHSLSGPVDLNSGPVVLDGRIATDPRIVDDEMRLEVDAASISVRGVGSPYSGRVRLFVRGNEIEPFAQTRRLLKGDAIRAWVELRAPEPVRTPGGFDQEAWAMRDGIHAFATCKNERLLQVTRQRSSPLTLMDHLRGGLRRSWRHVEDPLSRAVTASMVLGDEGALDRTTRDDFRAAGLLHLLVVSGSQVATLIFGLRRVMPLALRISWPGFAVESFVLVMYCGLAGADNSLLRATAMAIAFAASVRIDLSRAGVNLLAAAAVLILAVRPLDVVDPGAQMSFAAALSLITLAGPVARALASRRVPALAAEIAAGTLVATLATAPLSLIHFHRLSLIALPANLLAAPLAGLLLYASLLTAFLDATFVPGAHITGALCNGLAGALRTLAHEAAGTDPDWRGPSPPIILWVGVLCLLVLSGWRRRALPAACFLAALSLSGPTRGDGRLHLWFLDVGQGDAILIETPRGYAAAVDAGPALEAFDAGERIVGEALWTLGHRRLEFLAVTHRHSDHQGGAPFLIRHFKPGRVLVNEFSEALRPFSPTKIARGAEWTLDGVQFRVLAPDPGWPLPKKDENARSLVIEIQYGANSLLLLGDATSLTEGLVDAGGRRFDVVKVAHHGAVTSSSDNLIQRVQARFAVISVGARNRFSHPNLRVVERWSRAGALVWRTDLDQTLHLTSDGSRVRLESPQVRQTASGP